MTALSATLAMSSNRLALGQKSRQVVPAVQTPLGFQIPAEAQQDALFYYTRAAFDPCVGSDFSTAGARGAVSLTLLKVTSYKPSPKHRLTTLAARPTDCFTLTFQASGPLPSYVPIHTLDHPALGKIDLFLVEHATDNGLFYEAVVNHLI